MQIAIEHVTLAEALLPSLRGVRRLTLALAFSVLIGLSAQLAIPLPFTPVPITGQTFMVLLTGALLGRRLGVLAILCYLTEGGLGFPVFQGGTSGWIRLVGPTGGYLMAFPLAAYVVGWLAERGWDRRFFSALMMLLAGNAVILALGTLVLAHFVPSDQVLMAGLLPFLPGDLAKSVLAAAALPSGWKIVAKFNGV